MERASPEVPSDFLSSIRNREDITLLIKKTVDDATISLIPFESLKTLTIVNHGEATERSIFDIVKKAVKQGSDVKTLDIRACGYYPFEPIPWGNSLRKIVLHDRGQGGFGRIENWKEVLVGAPVIEQVIVGGKMLCSWADFVSLFRMLGQRSSPTLRELDVSVTKCEAYQNLYTTFLEEFPRFTSANLNLESLSFTGCDLSSYHFQAICSTLAPIKTLRKFVVRNNSVYPIDTKHLCALPQLKWLGLIDCKIRSDYFESLSNLVICDTQNSSHEWSFNRGTLKFPSALRALNVSACIAFGTSSAFRALEIPCLKLFYLEGRQFDPSQFSGRVREDTHFVLQGSLACRSQTTTAKESVNGETFEQALQRLGIDEYVFNSPCKNEGHKPQSENYHAGWARETLVAQDPAQKRTWKPFHEQSATFECDVPAISPTNEEEKRIARILDVFASDLIRQLAAIDGYHDLQNVDKMKAIERTAAFQNIYFHYGISRSILCVAALIVTNDLESYLGYDTSDTFALDPVYHFRLLAQYAVGYGFFRKITMLRWCRLGDIPLNAICHFVDFDRADLLAFYLVAVRQNATVEKTMLIRKQLRRYVAERGAKKCLQILKQPQDGCLGCTHLYKIGTYAHLCCLEAHFEEFTNTDIYRVICCSIGVGRTDVVDWIGENHQEFDWAISNYGFFLLAAENENCEVLWALVKASKISLEKVIEFACSEKARVHLRTIAFLFVCRLQSGECEQSSKFVLSKYAIAQCLTLDQWKKVHSLPRCIFDSRSLCAVVINVIAEPLDILLIAVRSTFVDAIREILEWMPETKEKEHLVICALEESVRRNKLESAEFLLEHWRKHVDLTAYIYDIAKFSPDEKMLRLFAKHSNFKSQDLDIYHVIFSRDRVDILNECLGMTAPNCEYLRKIEMICKSYECAVRCSDRLRVALADLTVDPPQTPETHQVLSGILEDLWKKTFDGMTSEQKEILRLCPEAALEWEDFEDSRAQVANALKTFELGDQEQKLPTEKEVEIIQNLLSIQNLEK